MSPFPYVSSPRYNALTRVAPHSEAADDPPDFGTVRAATRRRIATAITLAGLILSTSGCSPRATQTAITEKKSIVTTHDIRGEIVSVEAERRTLLVHHEEIPGYMPEMTMEFTVGDADIKAFHEKQTITGRMVNDGTGTLRLDGIQVVDANKDRIITTAAKQLRQETLIRGKSAYREVGEAAPSFTLLNQNGDVVSLDRFRGQRVVVNFIFTRCPIATMCPAATARMASLQRLAKERGILDLQLVSITLDPVHDTPPVLKAYAETRGIDSSNFSFLTGPDSAIRDLLTQFGVIAEPSDDLWKHSLATLLIGRDGKIIHRIDGSTWDTKDILERL